jgi:hypothetical protein
LCLHVRRVHAPTQHRRRASRAVTSARKTVNTLTPAAENAAHPMATTSNVAVAMALQQCPARDSVCVSVRGRPRAPKLANRLT